MSGAVHADRRSEGRCTASGYLCWKAYLPRSSWPTQPTTPIICARPSLPKARSPSSPTTRHGRSNIRSTSISMPSAISWSAASQNSNNSAASQPASKRQPEITVPSSLSQPSSYGCDKCPHHLDRDPETVILLDPRLVGAAGHVAPPILMVKVPVNCPAESCLELDAASIAEFDSQL